MDKGRVVVPRAPGADALPTVLGLAGFYCSACTLRYYLCFCDKLLNVGPVLIFVKMSMDSGNSDIFWENGGA